MGDFLIENDVLLKYRGKDKTVRIPDTVKIIGDEAFLGHPLESISLSKNLEKICCAAFNGCKNLKEIEIPQSVTFIDEWAFENCKKLESITIPESDNRIDKKAFCSCESLEEINFVSSE